ncbi:nucleotide exchange factor GrpE [Candidatus Saccharibacteria bacterium]|jgi:molecular chaperone GrpE|nr:nucleotide exchange factor GrpE [Candidatus Saccharibacteria bacterium]
MAKSKKQTELEQQVGELTQDLQRTRADFENYRKRVETEKEQAKESGKNQTIVKLLSIVDSIERAVSHVPEDLKENSWTDGVVKMAKNLDKMLSDLGLTKIQITPGKTPFDPELHNAVQADDTDGDTEVVAEELMTGYKKDNFVLRPAMVKVTHIHSDKKDK